MRPRGIVVLAGAVALWAAPASAAWRDLVPHPVENGAYLDLFASHERNENRIDGAAARWYDTFLRQKITVFSNGYVYHPRFLQYDLSLAGVLKQERYTASFLDDEGWSSASGLEYDGTITFLPEHPYNFELFARRYEPLFKEQSATQRENVESSRGALFRYRRKPYFFDARYSKDTVESDVTGSDITRFNASGEYNRRFASGRQLSVSAAHEASDFSASSGLEGSAVENQLNGVVDWQRVKFSASVLRNAFEQESDLSGRFENDQFAFYEIITAYLPLNFRGDVSYRVQNNETTIPAGGPRRSRDLGDFTEDYQVDIVHRLYQSLDTTYRYLRTDRNATGGDSSAQSHFLTFNYSKSIPRGRVMAGVNLGRVETVNEGRADIVNEGHAATPVPGVFTLNQPDVERRSIAVFLRSPLPPFQVVLLTEGLHYVVTPVANRFEINVILLPPQFTVPGVYDFFASYSLTSGEFELDTDSRGYNASVELLDHLLTPYYSYVTIRTKDPTGSFPGTTLDSTTQTAGVMFYKGVLRARGEYQRLDWEVSPYRSWRAELQAIGTMRGGGRLYATASHLDKRFPRGTSAQVGEGYSEATTSLSGGIQGRVTRQNLLLSAGGSLSRLDGLVDTLAYSLNGSLSWKVGKIDVSVGANAYRSDTEGTTAATITRSDEYYYVKIRRELF